MSHPHAAHLAQRVIRLAQLAESPDCFYPVMRERSLVRTAEGEAAHPHRSRRRLRQPLAARIRHSRPHGNAPRRS
ncbi:MAG: hypothetical protein ACLU5I_09560 [Alistipes finegoldii]